MPFKDRDRRRAYDKAYKRRSRTRGRTEKGLDTRLTEAERVTAEDLRGMLHEIWAEARNAAALLKFSEKIQILNAALPQQICRGLQHQCSILAAL